MQLQLGENRMIEFATKQDIPALQAIWMACFSDPDSYIQSYYEHRGEVAKTLIMRESDGTVSSMLDMIDITLVSNGNRYPAFYIYAASTLPEYQGRRYMHSLIEYACDFAAREGKVASLLIPQTKSLVDFYEKQDFTTPILIGQKEYPAKSTASILSPLSEQEFVQMKLEYERNHSSYLEHSLEMIALIYQQVKIAGGFVTKIETETTSSYAVYYKEKRKLWVQEISSQEESLENDLSAICEFADVKKAEVSFPGNTRLYGLARILQPCDIDWTKFYMNTMLD